MDPLFQITDCNASTSACLSNTPLGSMLTAYLYGLPLLTLAMLIGAGEETGDDTNEQEAADGAD